MSERITLVVSSLVSILAFIVHIADDMNKGLDKVGPQNTFGIVILVVWLYATLVLIGRRSGYIMHILFAVLSLAVFWIHVSDPDLPRVALAPGGLFFVAILFLFAATAAFSGILAVRGLLGIRKPSVDQ